MKTRLELVGQALRRLVATKSEMTRISSDKKDLDELIVSDYVTILAVVWGRLFFAETRVIHIITETC